MAKVIPLAARPFEFLLRNVSSWIWWIEGNSSFTWIYHRSTAAAYAECVVLQALFRVSWVGVTWIYHHLNLSYSLESFIDITWMYRSIPGLMGGGWRRCRNCKQGLSAKVKSSCSVRSLATASRPQLSWIILSLNTNVVGGKRQESNPRISKWITSTDNCIIR